MSSTYKLKDSDFDVQFTNVDIIRKILAGEVAPKELWQAFWFDLTKEGYDYWDRIRSREVLTPDASKKLWKMIQYK
jgi:hypothetical protein